MKPKETDMGGGYWVIEMCIAGGNMFAASERGPDGFSKPGRYRGYLPSFDDAKAQIELWRKQY